MSATDQVRSGIQAASVESELGAEPRGLRWREIGFLFSLLTLSIGLRLIHITQLFVDAWSWKQLTNAMISRNFYMQGSHFFYPQVSRTQDLDRPLNDRRNEGMDSRNSSKPP